MTGLTPGAVLENRYRIDQVVPAEVGSFYLGTALDTGTPIKVLELPPVVLRSLGRAQRLQHTNLCSVLAAIPRTGGHGLAVVEHVTGRTLADQLVVERSVRTDVAVVAALDLSDALVSMHQRGAAHGLITPSSVIMDPEGRPGVVLGYAPLSPPPNPYHSPERGIGPPSPADDVWALAAVMHQMVLGEPPPASGYRSRDELIAAGVNRDELVVLLGNCLARRPENRVSMAHAVRDLLASWISATQPSSLPNVPSVPPVQFDAAAPDPAATEVAPAESSRVPFSEHPPSVDPAALQSTPPAQVQPIVVSRQDPAARFGIWLPLAVAGAVLVVALVAALLVLGATQLGLGSRRVATPPASVAPTATSGPRAVASSSQPAPSDSAPQPQMAAPLREPTAAELATCVTAQLPAGSFNAPPKVDWLCRVTDPRRGYSKLRSALVLGAKGEVTKAMSLWSRVRWYGMASFTVIRARCCPNPPPFELPRTASCGSTAEILNELNDTIIAGKDHVPVLDRYTRNVRCHSNQGRDRFFGVDGELGGGQRTAFDELFEKRFE